MLEEISHALLIQQRSKISPELHFEHSSWVIFLTWKRKTDNIRLSSKNKNLQKRISKRLGLDIQAIKSGCHQKDFIWWNICFFAHLFHCEMQYLFYNLLISAAAVHCFGNILGFQIKTSRDGLNLKKGTRFPRRYISTVKFPRTIAPSEG